MHGYCSKKITIKKQGIVLNYSIYPCIVYTEAKALAGITGLKKNDESDRVVNASKRESWKIHDTWLHLFISLVILVSICGVSFMKTHNLTEYLSLCYITVDGCIL